MCKTTNEHCRLGNFLFLFIKYMQLLYLWYSNYRIAENFREFRGFVAIHESFLHDIWGVASFGAGKASNPQKFSPRKSYFHQFAKVFSLESFPLYGTSPFISPYTVVASFPGPAHSSLARWNSRRGLGLAPGLVHHVLCAAGRVFTSADNNVCRVAYIQVETSQVCTIDYSRKL